MEPMRESHQDDGRMGVESVRNNLLAPKETLRFYKTKVVQRALLFKTLQALHHF